MSVCQISWFSSQVVAHITREVQAVSLVTSLLFSASLVEVPLTDDFISASLHCFISPFLQTTNSDIANFLYWKSGECHS